MPVEERRIELPGSRTRVLERAGDGGRTVIFAHGITSSAATWRPYLEAMPEGVRAVAYDSLGSGFTERAGERRPITHHDQRGQLLELLDELGVERFTGVGHSMGCGALLGIAWRQPARVNGLLLLAPAQLGRRERGLLPRLSSWGPTARLLESGAPVFVPALAGARLRRLTNERPVPPDLREREAGHALERPGALVRGFVDIVGHADLRAPAPTADRWREIRVPVWIVRGAGDRNWMPEAHEQRYRELIPTARVMRWDGVGHSPHIEAPERFRGLLVEYLGSMSGDGSSPRPLDPAP
jgi:pimeloyl-ACP methyl ester carboxylesterase